MSNIVTVAEAANTLGITPHGVRYLIRAGRLKAARFGSAWVIQSADLGKIVKLKPGPRKSKSA